MKLDLSSQPVDWLKGKTVTQLQCSIPIATKTTAESGGPRDAPAMKAGSGVAEAEHHYTTSSSYAHGGLLATTFLALASRLSRSL